MLRDRFPNQVLASLDDDAWSRLEPHVEPVQLKSRHRLQARGEIIQQAIFPVSGLVSIVGRVADHNVEVAMAGHDGMTGYGIVLASAIATHDCAVAVEEEGLSVDAPHLRQALADCESLRNSVLRYVDALSEQIAETAVAIGCDTLQQRLARWLLMAHDRLRWDQIPLTHDALADTLGVRRPGITVALQMLEGERAIRNVRGWVTVLNREKLVQASGGTYLRVAERERDLSDPSTSRRTR